MFFFHLSTFQIEDVPTDFREEMNQYFDFHKYQYCDSTDYFACTAARLQLLQTEVRGALQGRRSSRSSHTPALVLYCNY